MAPRAIDPQILTQIVAQVLNEKKVEIIDWQQQELQGGTVAEVHLLEGQARRDQGETKPWSLVLKIQRQWTRWGDPESWQRELRLYQSNLFESLPPSLKVPSCFEGVEKNGAEIWLWLEKAGGRSGKGMTIDDYGIAARCLARFQGIYLVRQEIPSYAWLSSRRWVAKTLSAWSTEAYVWLESDRRQANDIFSADLIEATLALWRDRDRFLDVVDRLPRTLCHRDFNPANLFIQGQAQAEGLTIAIDWDSAGIGALGEDLGDLVGEALVFEDFDPSQVADLQEIVLEAYFAGLQEVGWKGDFQELLLSYTVHSPLQWCFRIPCRAKNEEHTHNHGKYRQAQRYMLDLANEARGLLGDAP